MDSHFAGDHYRILLCGQVADADEAHFLETWLCQVSGTGYVQTWTRLAWWAARAGLADLALHFAALAHRPSQDDQDDADSGAQVRLKLARAVLPVSRDEASEYFEQGLAILEIRLGEESRTWLTTLLSLAAQAGESRDPQPHLAYRLARTAEQVHTHNNHKFYWPDVVESPARLCPVTALALCGRWADRSIVFFDRTLANLLPTLLNSGAISIGQALSLSMLTPGWNRDELLDALLAKENNPGRRSELLDTFVLELALAAPHYRETRQIHKVAQRYGLASSKLDGLLGRPPDPESRRQMEQREQYTPQFGRTMSEPRVPLVGDFTRSEEIDRVMMAWEEEEPFSRPNRNEIVREMLATIPTQQRLAHLRAWLKAESVHAIDLLDVWKEIWRIWDTQAVHKEIQRLTKELIEVRAEELLGSGFSIGFLFGNRSGGPALVNHIELPPFIQAAAHQAQWFSADPLFRLGQDITPQLAILESREVLDFGLVRIESMQSAQEGDGKWRPDLAPPPDMTDAVAGLIWARLAAPEARQRWCAAHAVRRLCQTEEQDTLDALMARIESESGDAFVDARLPFYFLHARLYLLIALARVARENPPILRRYSAVFSRLALDGLPHVLMRSIAADAALALESAFPETYAADTLAALYQVNRSHLTPLTEWPAPPVHRRYQSELFRFGHDMEPYWFRPLGNVFAVPSAEIAERADRWIIEHSCEPRGWTWDADPRGSLYRDGETSHSHGSYPRTDELQFYLAYHAMFCVAGGLLLENPLLVDADDSVPFESWLGNHRLARADGEWLADRRDPWPIRLRPWQNEPDSEH